MPDMQLGLFGPSGTLSSGLSAGPPFVLESSFRCLGMVLPKDFHGATAPVVVISRALCMPASAARLSLCSLQWHQGALSASECSGGVWLWAFQDPVTASGTPWPLCSSHEQLICHCPTCQRPLSPYAVFCLACMTAEYEAGGSTP